MRTRNEPVQAWVYHCHLHPLQAANCCRNSRLAVDEYNINWVTLVINISLSLKQLHENCSSKTPKCIKLSHFFRAAKGCFDASWGFNPLTAKLCNFNFHSLEVGSRWRDPQLQVSENYSDLTKWRSTLLKSYWLMSILSLTYLKRST